MMKFLVNLRCLKCSGQNEFHRDLRRTTSPKGTIWLSAMGHCAVTKASELLTSPTIAHIAQMKKLYWHERQQSLHL
jgi:hypothetical protein